MKRYWFGKKDLAGVVCECVDGEYIRFADVQALAREILHNCNIGPIAIRKKLKQIAGESDSSRFSRMADKVAGRV